MIGQTECRPAHWTVTYLYKELCADARCEVRQHRRGRQPGTDGHALRAFTYLKHPEEGNTWKWKARWE